jgi:hypothetical protein
MVYQRFTVVCYAVAPVAGCWKPKLDEMNLPEHILVTSTLSFDRYEISLRRSVSTVLVVGRP